MNYIITYKIKLGQSSFFYDIIILGDNMSGFGILMIIFSISLFLMGLYMFTGHKLDVLTGKPSFKNLTIVEWKIIGKYTMIISVFVLMLGIIGIVFNFE